MSAALARAPAVAEIQSPRLEADLLLGAVTKLSRSQLIARGDTALSETQQVALEVLLARRLAGEPIAYLLGRREFWGLELHVSEATLVPRPETECLVAQCLARLPAEASLRVADLGTGSGAIAVALAHERPRWTLIGVDQCASALAIAARNRAELALDNLSFVRGDWSSALAMAKLDAIVSNPPYVAAGDPHLHTGDLRFEPPSALCAGPSGLEAIAEILRDAHRSLRPGGLMLIEHGWDQGEAVRRAMQQSGLCQVETCRDLAGHERVTVARSQRAAPTQRATEDRTA